MAAMRTGCLDEPVRAQPSFTPRHGHCSHAGQSPLTTALVRLKITRQPTGSIDGIQLDDFILGFTYDVGTTLGCYLLADRLAVPVADDSPTLVTPLKTKVRFDIRTVPAHDKVVPICAQPFQRPLRTHERSEAADRPRRRLRKRR
jgi:hypothetical protein